MTHIGLAVPIAALGDTALLYAITGVGYLMVLTLIITIHELGHFSVARMFKTEVDRFSLGFGPAIASRTDKHGIEWRIGAIPLGGYVRFAGDESVASVPDADDLAELRKEVAAREGVGAIKRYFHFKPLWQRALIVAAGPVANFVLATAIFSILLMAIGEQVLPARVDGVTPGTPAAAAGFRPGDSIIKANGKPIKGFNELKVTVALRSGTPIDFTVDRGGKLIHIVATPVRRDLPDQMGGHDRVGVLGIVSQIRASDVRTIRYSPPEAVVRGAQQTWEVIDTTIFYIGRWIRGAESGDQIHGPIGTLKAAGGAVQYGMDSGYTWQQKSFGVGLMLVKLAAVLSVAVGFVNLLPIPVLDGGHLLFYAYEGVARRPLGARAQAAGYRVGLALVLGLVIFATWNDVQPLRVFHFLGGLFS